MCFNGSSNDKFHEMSEHAPHVIENVSFVILMSTIIVQACDLNFSFGSGELEKQILFDVSFEIRAGEIVLLTGPSGSGKTTLLTLIGALRTVRSGSLTVFGQELLNASIAQQVEVRRRIGYIFQSHNLLNFLTARQNVQMSLELQPDFAPAPAKRRAAEVLSLVGLENRIDYYPDALSGGQKQRVAIARALAPQPDLVLADEPTAALDSRTGRDVVELMRRLAKEQGCPILMVTHDNRVLDIADRVIRMEDGRVA
jgi:putative ABC transport system ATP-binding protein